MEEPVEEPVMEKHVPTTADLLAAFVEAETPAGELARTPDLPADPEALLAHLKDADAPADQQAAAWQLLAAAGVEVGVLHPLQGGRTLTEERKAVFLETLAETGSRPAAAKAATPWSTGSDGGLATFKDERNRNPEFAEAWTQAEEAALARVEQEIVRRAFEPERRPIVAGKTGQVVAHHETFDNRLLLRLAAKLNPEWREHRKLEHEGTVQHEHTHGHTVVRLEARDVLLLPAEQRAAFMRLLEQIAAAKQEEPQRVIEHDATG